MKYNILVAGLGGLGIRYLQGLITSKKPLNIIAIDPNKNSIQKAKEFLKNFKILKYYHKVNFYSSYNILPLQINLAIIATTADVRLEVVENITKNSFTQNWILEKVLSQNIYQMNKISILTKPSKNVWVNFPRREMKWYRKLYKHISSSEKMNVYVGNNNWGLACNSVHFIDLVSWLTKDNVLNMNLENLNINWVESKRKGFYEVYGKYEILFKKGSKLILESLKEGKKNEIHINNNNKNWTINEGTGEVFLNNKLFKTGKIEMQSEMTCRIVEQILLNGKSNLTKLNDAIKSHETFLERFLSHWNKTRGSMDASIPIT